MKILLMAYSDMSSHYIQSFTSQLAQYLVQSNHEVGCLLNFDISQAASTQQNQNFKPLDSVYSATQTDWDIVIVQHRKMLYKTRSFKKLPVIFISHLPNFDNYTAVFNNLYKIVVFYKQINSVFWGVPPELIHPIQPNIFLKKERRKIAENEISILFHLPPVDICHPIMKSAVNILNFNSHLSIEIIGSKTQLEFLKPYVNDNITLSNKMKTPQKKLSNYSLILASQNIAIESVLLEIPTIVVGEKGLGGIVTDDNIDLFIKYGFNGRPGGASSESISLELFHYEVAEALRRINNKISFVSKDKKETFTKKYSNHVFLKEILKIIESATYSRQVLDNICLDSEITPKLSRNLVVSLFDTENRYFIVRNNMSGKVLGALEEKQTRNIAKINGVSTIKEIASCLSKTEADEFITLIKKMFIEKVIFI